MERMAIYGFSCIGINGVFLILLAERLGWPTFKDFMLHTATAAWVQAVGSIGAIFAAAWVVYRQHSLAEQSRQVEQVSVKVDSVNGMMLVLMRQLNALLAYRKQILEPERANTARHFALPPVLPLKLSNLQVDWAQYAYFARTAAAEALMQLILAHDAFHSAVDAINQRNQVHRDELQPKIEVSGIDMEQGVSGDVLAKAVGLRLTHTMKAGTDSIYELVDLAIQLLQVAGKEAPKSIQSVYPGRPINGFGII
ncbi:MAG TPA: hypothetical protein VFR90_13380 [Methylibium sp.]|uniref:hypothetical protein n=1 Tax=Methylibium sp. TaxID=2067992 RepID=UPI002DB89C55|nr:hypothetical protein [Methylibium sp.]HEU4460108.1 hypothetical protein [Methylibium sp.]